MIWPKCQSLWWFTAYVVSNFAVGIKWKHLDKQIDTHLMRSAYFNSFVAEVSVYELQNKHSSQTFLMESPFINKLSVAHLNSSSMVSFEINIARAYVRNQMISSRKFLFLDSHCIFWYYLFNFLHGVQRSCTFNGYHSQHQSQRWLITQFCTIEPFQPELNFAYLQKKSYGTKQGKSLPFADSIL